jgi:hypothetical protein
MPGCRAGTSGSRSLRYWLLSRANYDLAAEVAELDARFSGVTERALRAAMHQSCDS